MSIGSVHPFAVFAFTAGIFHIPAPFLFICNNQQNLFVKALLLKPFLIEAF
jgi:uncharacterized membrane protein